MDFHKICWANKKLVIQSPHYYLAVGKVASKYALGRPLQRKYSTNIPSYPAGFLAGLSFLSFIMECFHSFSWELIFPDLCFTGTFKFAWDECSTEYLVMYSLVTNQLVFPK